MQRIIEVKKMIKEVIDEESGIKLRYSWDDNTGWGFIVSGYSTNETRRQAAKIAHKHLPNVPEEHRERIEKNNKDIIDFCKGFKHDE